MRSPFAILDEEWKIIDLRSFKFLALVGLFIFVGFLVIFHLTDIFDLAAVNSFHAIRGASLDGLMIAITVTGDVTTMFAVGIVLTIIRRTRRIGLTILISLVVTSVLLVYIKPLYGRPLPPYQFIPQIPLPDKFTLEQDVLGFTHSAYSFPSGHETRAVAFSFLVGFFLVRKYGLLGHFIWLYPLLIGISRLYLFAHYPTDLVGSAILGILLANVIAKILKFDKSPAVVDTKFAKQQ